MVQKNYKSKEMGTIVELALNHVGERLENNISRFVWQASVNTRNVVGCGIYQDNAISRGINFRSKRRDNPLYS